MAEGFDPYLQWLGIRDPIRPPNHYRLLGVELFENDPDVISNAADRQMAHVRTFQAGPRSAESQRILNELAGAKVCLLNPPKKETYDAQLRAELASASPTPPAPPPGEPAPPVVPPSRARPASRKLAVVWVSLSVIVAMGVVLAALVMLVLGGRSSPNQEFELVRSEETGDTPGAVSGVQPSPGTSAGEGPKSDKGPKTEPPKPPDGKMPPKTAPESGAKGPPAAKEGPKATDRTQGMPGKDAKSTPEVAKAPAADAKSPPKPTMEPLPPVAESIQAARSAMKQRDPAAARKHIELARKAANPGSEAEKTLDRLQDVFLPWEAFWTAVRSGMAECKPGEMLRVEGQTFEVVRSGEESLAVRVAGTDQRFTLRDLPTGLALAMADKKLPENLASLPKAAFLVVDPNGDPQQAKELCQQSSTRPGAGLTAELRQALGPKEPTPEPAPAAPKARPRLPVPDAAAQEAARKDVQDVHKAGFTQAKTPAEKSQLAKELLREAKETKDNPVARYVLLAEVRDLAVAAGDIARLREAAVEMSEAYQVEALEEQTRVLAEATQTLGLPSPVRADLARGAIDVAKEAIQADAYDAAAQLLETALVLAKKVSGGKYRDPNTIHQANELRGLIPWYKDQFNLAQQAEKALTRDPTNVKALQFLGKYYVLLKDSGDRGLPLLLKSGDPALQALAESAQALPRSPGANELAKLGHLWRGAAGTMEEPWRRLALQRALFCYETALPKLKGFPQTQVAKIIEELKSAETTRRKP